MTRDHRAPRPGNRDRRRSRRNRLQGPLPGAVEVTLAGSIHRPEPCYGLPKRGPIRRFGREGRRGLPGSSGRRQPGATPVVSIGESRSRPCLEARYRAHRPLRQRPSGRPRPLRAGSVRASDSILREPASRLAEPLWAELRSGSPIQPSLPEPASAEFRSSISGSIPEDRARVARSSRRASPARVFGLRRRPATRARRG